MLLFHFGYFEDWELYHKVTFDGENKLILINFGITDIDVAIDIYSDWKEWIRIRDNAKYEQAMRVVGGDPVGGGEFLGDNVFLINGWRCRTWEGDHILNVSRNLRIDESDPDIATSPNVFLPTLDPHNITINSNFSVITNTIQVSGSGGGFADDDRTTLESIESLVTVMYSDVRNIISSSFLAAASVLSGSTSTVVRTTLTNPDNRFEGMSAIIRNTDGGEARQIDSYTLLSGTLQLHPPLSFTPQAGDSVVIIPNSDFRFK